MRRFSIIFSLVLFSALFCHSQSLNYNLKKVDWTFSESDFKLDLKEEKIDQGSYKINIVRKSPNETERLLIRKAEALYPKENLVEKPKSTTAAEKKVFSPTVEEAPFWSLKSFDGVKIAAIVSTRSINYYLELSSAYRNNQKPTAIEMSKTAFSYSAVVVHYDKYDFRRENFENVNVVFLKMKWSQYCGGLCAMGFTREKFVVFDKNNEPLAVFTDMETGVWVS